LNFSIFPALLLRFKEFEQVGLLVAEIMDIDGVDDDLHILDPELLQLPGLSPSPLKPTSLIADDLFSQWLSLPETATLVATFLFLHFLPWPLFYTSVFHDLGFPFFMFL
jgi:hypothetical protein